MSERASEPTSPGGHFLNPYNFVSIPPRPPAGHLLGDGSPPGHDRYREDGWSGSIPITITTTTPLLIPDHTDAARREPDAKATPPLDVRVDHQGRPLLAGSAVKGMLRSAYEAVTNSRLGVFAGDVPLAIRATARDALGLLPAWVSARTETGGRITWVDALKPTKPIDGDHKKEPKEKPEPSPVVWAPIDLLGELEDTTRVVAWIELLDYPKGPARIWRTMAIAASGENLPKPDAFDPKDKKKSPFRSLRYPLVKVQAILHRTRSKFPAEDGPGKKGNERLVVTAVDDGPARVSHSKKNEGAIGPDLLAVWRGVIDSFVNAHSRERNQEKRFGTYVWDRRRWDGLQQDRTLYVLLNQNREIISVLPALIGRRPFSGVPADSLPEEHHPAQKIDELSPADRVFGWTRHRQHDDTPANSTTSPKMDRTAYRGHLRVEPAGEPPSKGTIRWFGSPLTLTTLNSPKPSRFQFYLGDADGRPLDKVSKDPNKGYVPPKDPPTRRLRGRKVYLTHQREIGNAHYWNPEQRAPKAYNMRGENNTVATTVTSWVNPEAEFTFTIRFDNLNDLELGALLWLLRIGEPDEQSDEIAYHKIGLGKPLGFGAIRVLADWGSAQVHNGQQMIKRYTSLTPQNPASKETLDGLVNKYEEVSDLDQVRSEFLAAAKGYAELPVHYPRTGPEPSTKSYKWWGENDKKARLALPMLDAQTPPTLPYNEPSDKQSSSGKPKSREH